MAETMVQIMGRNLRIHSKIMILRLGGSILEDCLHLQAFHPQLPSLPSSFVQGEDGKLALDVLARAFAYVVLLAGVPAIPFRRSPGRVGKILRETIPLGDEKDIEACGRACSRKDGHGGIPALMGIDISGSLKTESPLSAQGLPVILYTGSMEDFSAKA